MNDRETTNGAATDRDLRPVIVRLTDIQRKCRSAGARNREADDVDRRLTAILDRLGDADEPDAEPPPFAALARELFAVERFFESNGFLSVAKEVAHVERLLEKLAAPGETAAPWVPRPEAQAAVERDRDRTAGRDEDDRREDEAGPEEPSRWAIPRPLAGVIVVFVAALAVCVAIIARHELGGRPRVLAAPAIPSPTPPLVQPSTPTPAPRDAERTPAPGAVLATEVGRARLALVEGDVDAVVDHLSRAALVDPDHQTVLGTAQQLVDLLVARADSAAESGLWEVADLTLGRAEGLAIRFGLETLNIEETRARHARLDRFRFIRPSETAAIRAAAGARVTVIFKDGSTRASIIKDVDGLELLLDEDTTVRGGALYYVDRVPLSEIEVLKVWE
ncbi:MAG: hypothetical protein MUC56_01855 [Thermoanaerobaculales bacterium]|nr:hypothetical protein [Thermoanaerobaculales bacterium]